jgi:VanZ family protein
MRTRLLDLICFVVLCVVLTLGLWPFHSPKNDVSWLHYRNGVRFGSNGTAFSSHGFDAASAIHDAQCTVEIWLKPGRRWARGTILAFYNPATPNHISINQSLSDLELKREVRRQPTGSSAEHLYVANAFRRPEPLFLAITSGARGTEVYLNGLAAGTAPQFRILADELTGRLILAGSPGQPDVWRGDLMGLAIYQAELNATQVRRHFQTWVQHERPEVSAEDRNVLLYLFDERGGTTVHDRASSGLDLQIPENYAVLDKISLEPVWREFNMSRSYWSAAAKNVIGFVPFGFCFYAWLLAHKARWPAQRAVVLGFLVSLTIEVLQAYLPTRDSGTTDILTNTLGTYSGIWIYRALCPILAGPCARFLYLPSSAPAGSEQESANSSDFRGLRDRDVVLGRLLRKQAL